MKADAKMLSYPEEPGWKATQTSFESALRAKTRDKSLQARCLEVLKHHGFTADEIARELGETPFSIRPRISQLFKKHLIVDTGVTRPNDSGHPATVWRAR